MAYQRSQASLASQLKTVIVFRTLQPHGSSRLTHVGERSLAGGGVRRTGGRRQLRGTFAVCHAEYGVGVAPSRFASFTLREA